MTYMFFFLKFKSQLRRTRPEIIRNLDESLTRAIKDAGGKITGDRFVISAVFNEEKIGFWLDMYILIESLKNNIETSNEYFGYSLVISCKSSDTQEMLSRHLSSYNGVFVDEKAAKSFVPYAVFEKPSEWHNPEKKRKYGCGNYYRIKELKNFNNTSASDPQTRNDIFEKENGKNILVLGSGYSRVNSGLNEYCEKINGDFPALTFSFGSIGIGALVDSWSPSIRSLDGGDHEELDKLWELLFRERIRDEVSEYIFRCVRRFLYLVFEYYFNSAKKKSLTPIIVFDNIQLAGIKITDILLNSLEEYKHEKKKELLCFGTGESDISPDKLRQWESVFDSVMKTEDDNKIFFPKLSNELWEIIYAISLFGRYFSSELFQRLFEENDINPSMIIRAFSILNNLCVIDNAREPRCANRQLEEHAKKILEQRCEKVKELVRGRLLSWAGRRNINPCFRLLSIISDMDGAEQIDDLLLLKAFSSDIINDTISGIETAMANGQFEEMLSDKAPALQYIFNTTRALHAGNEQDIEEAFSTVTIDKINSDFDSFPVLKTQILINLGAYYLGRHEKKEAAMYSKEAILLGQNKNSFCLPQAYRIFSLVCLSKKQVTETIEYLNFALSNAEKNDNYHELAISSYYAAAAQFLHGDVYNSAKLARKSVEQSLGAGRSEWADRSRFLEGRIEFDLGHYRQALEIFESLRSEPYGSRTEEKDSLMAAWIYRCKNYINNFSIPKPEKANYDADLFEIEAAYLTGNYQKAFDLSSSMNNPFLNENFLYTEQADWRSGFVQCEHLYFTNGEIQDRMICLFQSLSLSHISAERGEEALANIQKILRDEKLCEMDPWDAFYFYAKYRILQQIEASPVDLSTAVSMAFKRLQRRAGRIEDIETCRQYLNEPRWNKELSQAAKEYKLI